ncbi:hypothetical protein Mapa_015843 [Marchantia paleacea]|nr:hypothetical protein Mapa_015843 [Marchantia paleacea]
MCRVQTPSALCGLTFDSEDFRPPASSSPRRLTPERLRTMTTIKPGPVHCPCACCLPACLCCSGWFTLEPKSRSKTVSYSLSVPPSSPSEP